jgi:hypothetical protein
MPEFLAQSYHPRDAPGTAARTGDAVMTVPIEIQAGSHAITAGPLPHLAPSCITSAAGGLRHCGANCRPASSVIAGLSGPEVTRCMTGDDTKLLPATSIRPAGRPGRGPRVSLRRGRSLRPSRSLALRTCPGAIPSGPPESEHREPARNDRYQLDTRKAQTMATTIQQLPAPTAVSDQDSLIASLPARPGTPVSVMGPCRPAAVSIMGRDRGTADPVMGRDRGTADSVMGPCRPAAVSVMGRDRGTSYPITAVRR